MSEILSHSEMDDLTNIAEKIVEWMDTYSVTYTWQWIMR